MRARTIVMYPPASYFGKSFEEWSILWWKWLLAIDKHNNPALDMTGDFARFNQEDQKVLFLCQTYEKSPAMPKRRIIVRPRITIFMPLINFVATAPVDGRNEFELTSTARQKIDSVQKIELQVNNTLVPVRLKEHRVITAPFRVYLSTSNLLGMPEGEVTCLSDGYWIMFDLIEKNTTISSWASCSSGRTTISAEYLITCTD